MHVNVRSKIDEHVQFIHVNCYRFEISNQSLICCMFVRNKQGQGTIHLWHGKDFWVILSADPFPHLLMIWVKGVAPGF
jgi:hypothetical protein